MAVRKKKKTTKKTTKVKTAGSRTRKAKKSSGASRKKSAKSRPALSPEAMMAACQKAATPGKGHRSLDALAGSWNARTTFWMAPNAPPATSDGVSEHRWVLGGRYLEQVYRGDAMGGPFEGIGYTGYDNGQQRFVGTWMDSMGTGIMTSLGAGRPTDSKIAFMSRYFDPSSRKEVLFETLIRIQNRDHHTFEMWTRAPNGKRFRTMLAEYTRRS